MLNVGETTITAGNPIVPKQLLIMRHAKSSWSHSGLTDHQRPLNSRGLGDAPRMAKLIALENLAPELVVSSTANRAKTTAQLFVENCPGANPEIITTDDFYHASPGIYLDYATGFADTIDIAMAIGHNPGMEDLVEMLAGEYERMPTAAIAHIAFDVDTWPEISIENCSLQALWRPKEI